MSELSLVADGPRAYQQAGVWTIRTTRVGYRRFLFVRAHVNLYYFWEKRWFFVAAAVAMAGKSQFRRSVSGMPGGPVCGMGICCECRVTINNEPHQRSCVTLCEEGMEVRTDG